MISVGLTGGIASGKSEVGRLLSALAARLLDADAIAHQTYAPGSTGFEAVIRAFGVHVLAADGSIDRRALGGLVFGNEARMSKLTSIVWPRARALVESAQQRALEEGVEVFVVEAALLLEAGWPELFDEVWLVTAAESTVQERLRSRGLDEAAIEARLASQPGLESRIESADRLIENDGTLAELAAQVEAAWSSLRASR